MNGDLFSGGLGADVCAIVGQGTRRYGLRHGVGDIQGARERSTADASQAAGSGRVQDGAMRAVVEGRTCGPRSESLLRPRTWLRFDDKGWAIVARI